MRPIDSVAVVVVPHDDVVECLIDVAIPVRTSVMAI